MLENDDTKTPIQYIDTREKDQSPPITPKGLWTSSWKESRTTCSQCTHVTFQNPTGSSFLTSKSRHTLLLIVTRLLLKTSRKKVPCIIPENAHFRELPRSKVMSGLVGVFLRIHENTSRFVVSGHNKFNSSHLYKIEKVWMAVDLSIT